MNLRCRPVVVLKCPSVAYDQASADPGQLAQPGFLGDLVDEALAALGVSTWPGRVVVSTHSGGYKAAAAAALVGWSPRGSPVQELWLFDSLCTPYIPSSAADK